VFAGLEDLLPEVVARRGGCGNRERGGSGLLLLADHTGKEREKGSPTVAALGCWRTQNREEGVVSPWSEIDCWLLGDVAPQQEVGIVVLTAVITK